MDIADFLEWFTAWLRGRPDVCAAAVVGSYARGSQGIDSDVDLLILTTDVEAYFQNHAWTLGFGEVETTSMEDWGNLRSLRTFYKSGLEVEYGFSTPDWANVPADGGTRRVVAGGLNVLYDPAGILAKLKQDAEDTE